MVQYNMNNVSDIRKYFINELKAENFVTDKTGQKTIEMIGASFLANQPSIFGEPNQQYIDAEINWYNSKSTNINDIYKGSKKPPQAWQYSANGHGEINSNYGFLIYDDKFYSQYWNALDELLMNVDTSRATMIYTRPSIWAEYNENKKNDFICTNAVTYYIRGGKINCVVQMRSNDVVYGYKNDYAWQKHVLECFTNDYNRSFAEKTWDADYRRDMEIGDIIWQVQNLHVYERHFDLVV